MGIVMLPTDFLALALGMKANPFRNFKTSSAVNRLAVMMYVRLVLAS